MKIGFVGLGVMGRPMVKNLLHAGYDVIVYGRNPIAVEDVASAGADRGDSIEDVAQVSDVFFSMLPNSPEVKEVVLDHALAHLRPGATVVDMSSIDPTVSREINGILEKSGIDMLDAPVSGGEPKAIDGTLAFMVGGKQEVFDHCVPLLSCMGSSVTLCGDIGAGNVTKLCNQIVVAGNIAVLSEAMMLGQLAGVKPEKIYQAICGGLAGSTVMDAKAPMMMDRNFQPGFRIDLHIKDLTNVVNAAKAVSAPVPMTCQVLEMMKILHRDGNGSADHSALICYYEKLTGEKLHR